MISKISIWEIKEGKVTKVNIDGKIYSVVECIGNGTEKTETVDNNDAPKGVVMSYRNRVKIYSNPVHELYQKHQKTVFGTTEVMDVLQGYYTTRSKASIRSLAGEYINFLLRDEHLKCIVPAGHGAYGRILYRFIPTLANIINA